MMEGGSSRRGGGAERVKPTQDPECSGGAAVWERGCLPGGQGAGLGWEVEEEWYPGHG